MSLFCRHQGFITTALGKTVCFCDRRAGHQETEHSARIVARDGHQSQVRWGIGLTDYVQTSDDIPTERCQIWLHVCTPTSVILTATATGKLPSFRCELEPGHSGTHQRSSSKSEDGSVTVVQWS